MRAADVGPRAEGSPWGRTRTDSCGGAIGRASPHAGDAHMAGRSHRSRPESACELVDFSPGPPQRATRAADDGEPAAAPGSNEGSKKKRSGRRRRTPRAHAAPTSASSADGSERGEGFERSPEDSEWLTEQQSLLLRRSKVTRGTMLKYLGGDGAEPPEDAGAPLPSINSRGSTPAGSPVASPGAGFERSPGFGDRQVADALAVSPTSIEFGRVRTSRSGASSGPSAERDEWSFSESHDMRSCLTRTKLLQYLDDDENEGADDEGAADAGAADAGAADVGAAYADAADTGTADTGADDAGADDAGALPPQSLIERPKSRRERLESDGDPEGAAPCLEDEAPSVEIWQRSPENMASAPCDAEWDWRFEFMGDADGNNEAGGESDSDDEAAKVWDEEDEDHEEEASAPVWRPSRGRRARRMASASFTADDSAEFAAPRGALACVPEEAELLVSVDGTPVEPDEDDEEGSEPFARPSRPRSRDRRDDMMRCQRAPELGQTLRAGGEMDTEDASDSAQPPSEVEATDSNASDDTYAAWIDSQVGWPSDTPDTLRSVLLAAAAGDVPLLEAAMAAYAEESPAEEGAAVDEPKDEYGNTVLLIAAHAGRRRIVRWSVDLGADVNLTNRFGNTALHIALERARETTRARGEPAGNKSKGSKKGSRPRSCAQIARFLLSRGARDDIQNQMGLTCRQRIQLDATG